MRYAFGIWLPLTISNLLMNSELVLILAVVARGKNSELHVAALGVAASLAVAIESPTTMIFSASVRFTDVYPISLILRSLTLRLGIILVILAMAIAFTPAYYFMTQELLGIPLEIAKISRIGFVPLVIWPFMVAIRRYHQGIIVGKEKAYLVSIGTFFRILTGPSVAMVLLMHTSFEGVVAGTIGLTFGVTVEAIYNTLVCHNLGGDKSTQYENLDNVPPSFLMHDMISLFMPLSITTILFYLIQPTVSAGLTRMPYAINSLICWPVIWSFILLISSFGQTLQETAIQYAKVRITKLWDVFAFSLLITTVSSFMLFIISITSVNQIYLRHISGLPRYLVEYAQGSLLFGIPIPFLIGGESLLRGILIVRDDTKGVVIGMIIFFALMSVILLLRIVTSIGNGLNTAIATIVIAFSFEVAFLFARAKKPNAYKH